MPRAAIERFMKQYLDQVAPVLDLEGKHHHQLVKALAQEFARRERRVEQVLLCSFILVILSVVVLLGYGWWTAGGAALGYGAAGLYGVLLVISLVVGVVPGIRHLCILWPAMGFLPLAVFMVIGLLVPVEQWLASNLSMAIRGAAVGLATYFGVALVILWLGLLLVRLVNRYLLVNTRAYVLLHLARVIDALRGTGSKKVSAAHLLPSDVDGLVLHVEMVAFRCCLVATSSRVHVVEVESEVPVPFLRDHMLERMKAVRQVASAPLEELKFRFGFWYDTVEVGNWSTWVLGRSMFLYRFVQVCERTTAGVPASFFDRQREELVGRLRDLERSTSKYFQRQLAVLAPQTRGWLESRAVNILATMQEWQRWVLHPRADTFRHIELLLVRVLEPVLLGEWDSFVATPRAVALRVPWLVRLRGFAAWALLWVGAVGLVLSPASVRLPIGNEDMKTLGFGLVWLALLLTPNATFDLDIVQKFKKLASPRD